jgi:hypothetical protein
MQTQAFVAPRDFTPGAGLPGDRRARLAARLAFDDLKRTFLHVLQGDDSCHWLRTLVEQADEPVELWLLRAPAFAALQGVAPDQRLRRQMLRRGLDTLFPEQEPDSGFAPL